jgi:arylsulfatase A-like enzyme
VLVTIGACVTPAWPWLLAEILLFVGAGALISRTVPVGWKSGLAAPGALLILTATWRSGVIASWAQLPSYAVGPVLLVVAVRVFHQLTRRLTPLVPAVLLSLVGIGVSRFIHLIGSKVALPGSQLVEDLTRPTLALRAAPEGPGGPPIIVISIDTLRADAAMDTQTWAWFQRHGATWSAAQSTASWTVPAVGSIWTGLLPADHGAGDLPVGFASLKPAESGVVTLAEQAREQGYQTAAFVVNPFVSTSLGFRRGFDDWINPDEAAAQPLALLGERWPLPGRDGKVVVDHALEWLEDAPEDGFLLWVHLFDPHLPYTHVPDDHPALVVKHPKQVRRGKIEATEALKAAVSDAYHTEVAYSDAVLQPLLQAIEARGFHERGAVVFLSDHGEELWEHGDFEHGHSHHKEVTEIPLALVAPCVKGGERRGVASLQDVAPTLRGISGIPALPAELQGIDLCQPIPEDRVALAAGNLYGAPQASVRTLSEKVIETRPKKGKPRSQLFDLTTDPGELQGQRSDEDHWLARAAAEMQTAADGQNTAPVADDLLCELGYVDCPDQQ